MPLFDKLEAAGAIGPASRKRITPLDPEERRRFDELEEELPVQSILMFRGMVREKVGKAWLFFVMFVFYFVAGSLIGWRAVWLV